MQQPKHLRLNGLINSIAGNHPVNTVIFPDVAVKHALSQIGIISDEVDELVQGLADKDYLEIRDGVADVIVTVDGLLYRMGQSYPATWRTRVDSFLRFCFDADPDKLGAVIQEYVQTLRETVQKIAEEDRPDWAAIVGHCEIIMIVCHMLAAIYDFDVETDQEVVFNANHSKFDTTPEDAVATTQKYEAIDVATYVQYVINPLNGGHYYIVKSKHDQVDVKGKMYRKDKFLKSVNFQEPQFA